MHRRGEPAEVENGDPDRASAATRPLAHGHLPYERFVLQLSRHRVGCSKAFRFEPGTAADTARAAGSRLRTNPAVAAVIPQTVVALNARCNASSDRWLLEVLEVAYADPD